MTGSGGRSGSTRSTSWTSMKEPAWLSPGLMVRELGVVDMWFLTRIAGTCCG
jgi:hypothetical protein